MENDGKEKGASGIWQCEKDWERVVIGFFFIDAATTEVYTLSRHGGLPN